MSTSTDAVSKLAVTKNTPDGQKDENVHTAAWRNRKESVYQSGLMVGGLKPPKEQGSRRMSTIRDVPAFQLSTKNLPGMRRLTISMRAKSDISADILKPQVRKENTYRMKPNEGKVFSVSKVHKAVTALFEDELDGVVYDYNYSSKLLCDISEKIKDRVKDLHFARYKIAVNVMIGQTADQGMEVASRSVWDSKTDNSVCVTYQNKSLFVIALIFGIYFE